MKIAQFTDGTTVRYDRTETHDEVILFFRAPIGLVHARTVAEFKQAKVKDDDNSST